MKPPLDTYGDNFPVAEGFSWNPRVPWRHAHVRPGQKVSWVRWAGWWMLVMVLMGALLVLATQDGFSEEPALTKWERSPSGELLVRFKEGALSYPDGASRVLIHQVQFGSASLRDLGVRYGLITIEQVRSPDRLTRRLFRLHFASQFGLERALAEYRKNPGVISAEMVPGLPSPKNLPGQASVYTRDA